MRIMLMMNKMLFDFLFLSGFILSAFRAPRYL